VADNGLVGGLECPSFSHRVFVSMIREVLRFWGFWGWGKT